MQYAVTYSYDDENGERKEGVRVFSNPFEAKKYRNGTLVDLTES